MKRLEVAATPPYTVTVGRGALGQVQIPEARRALLYDSGLPSALVRRAVDQITPEVVLPVPPRDASKTLAVYADALSTLARAALPRDSAVIGLGGGAATDLAGFVAASYLRGVAFYTLPTTLLAQVDAAVGGKTGVNLPEGKNLVGAFWNPRGVWCDVGLLASLPDPMFREGAAEVFKHGLLTNLALCNAVLAPGFGPAAPDLAAVVADAVQVKVDVVTRDPTERGERAHLNLGHTLAHALEALTRQRLPHGDAVGYGLHFAALLSEALGARDLSVLTRQFLEYQRPAPIPAFEWDVVAPFIARDKKADQVGVRFVLLHGVGQPYLARVPEGVLRDTLKVWRAQLPGVVE